MPFNPATDDLTQLLTGPAYIFYTPDLSTLRLPVPSAPLATGTTGGGTVAAGTYQVAVSYVNAYGETIVSPATPVVLSAAGTLTIPSPPAFGTGGQAATGWNAYVSQAGATALTKQNGAPTAIGTALTISAPPTSSGSAPPAWDTSGALPQKLDDIVSLSTPYTVKSPWIPGGALSRDNVSAVRNIATNAVTTAHTNVPVTERVTNTTRTLSIPWQEVKAAIRQIAENAPAIETIAQGLAASGTPAQSRVRMGGITQLTRRRIAVIAERDPGVTGATTEGGARGQLFGYVLFNCAISAQGTNLDLHPDNAVSQAVQFDAFPEPNAPDVRYSHGATLFETGFVIP